MKKIIFFKVLLLLGFGFFDEPEIIRLSTLGRQPVVLGGLYSGKINKKIEFYFILSKIKRVCCRY